MSCFAKIQIVASNVHSIIQLFVFVFLPSHLQDALW